MEISQPEVNQLLNKPQTSNFINQPTQSVNQPIGQPEKQSRLKIGIGLVSLLVILQSGWLGFRGWQYLNRQKIQAKLAQKQQEEQEKEAEVLLQEIPEPKISKEFLEYYSSESGKKK